MAILHKDKYYEKEKLYALFLAIAFRMPNKKSTYGTSKTFA